MLKGIDGVNVAVSVTASYAIEPSTTADDGSVTTISWPVTGWLNPTATVVLTSTAVAPGAGVCDVTVGRTAVAKLHVTGAILGYASHIRGLTTTDNPIHRQAITIEQQSRRASELTRQLLEEA